MTQVSPNNFQGTDTERIQAAIGAAANDPISNKVVIPALNSNGTGKWIIDSAILVPSNITVILDSCTLQLSDKSRDNMFRSDNVGASVSSPEWNRNIRIIGKGNAVLRGANNPRATGDAKRKLVLDHNQADSWRVSYGSDAGKEGEKQTGDWRNILILMAYVDDFSLKGVSIENSHTWACSFERVHNAELSGIKINNEDYLDIDGKKVKTANKDGIDLRQGCKRFVIKNLSGYTEDDFIALSNLGSGPDAPQPHGNIDSTMVTSSTWFGPEDDIEDITISHIDCSSSTRAIAIRASGSKGVHHVKISNVTFKAPHERNDTFLIGGQGYGEPSLPGKINNVSATNFVGNGSCLVNIEAAIADCRFTNGTYTGPGEQLVVYSKIHKSEARNVVCLNIASSPR